MGQGCQLTELPVIQFSQEQVFRIVKHLFRMGMSSTVCWGLQLSSPRSLLNCFSSSRLLVRVVGC